MPRPKGSKNKIVELASVDMQEAIAQEDQQFEVDTDMRNRQKRTIAKLSVDYPSEGLNNMASKINEIIDALHKC